ncbi:MAG TPA: hypothetical protein VMG80_01680 [Solirubrobacteraceae bacterium]|nr:hypothetical protein [Solirubrobacteraceae bacterium]
MRTDRWPRGTALALLAVAAAGVCGLATTGSAVAARVLNVKDEGRLRLLTSYGSELIDEGPATGTVPGRVKVDFLYNGDPSVSARFEIYGRGGTIGGRANARLSNPTSPVPSFRGAFTITGGSGRYAHVSGRGELFGVFYRRGYGLVVQTVGRLSY